MSSIENIVPDLRDGTMELNPAFATNDSVVHIPDAEHGHETQTAVKITPTIVLDSSGDVILKLGTISLHVSSKVLSVASPVFLAMFGPHFQEGETLSRRCDTELKCLPPLIQTISDLGQQFGRSSSHTPP